MNEVLAKAADLIDSGWCQGSLARDEKGWWVAPTSPNAVEWCVVGAVQAAAGQYGVETKEALDALRAHLAPDEEPDDEGRLRFALVPWNDNAEDASVVSKALRGAAA